MDLPNQPLIEMFEPYMLAGMIVLAMIFMIFIIALIAVANTKDTVDIEMNFRFL